MQSRLTAGLSPPQESRVQSVTSYVPTLLLLALVLYVLDFYVESISANRWAVGPSSPGRSEQLKTAEL